MLNFQGVSTFSFARYLEWKMSIFAQLAHHDQHQPNIHHYCHYFFIPIRPSYWSSNGISGHMGFHLSLHHVGFQAISPAIWNPFPEMPCEKEIAKAPPGRSKRSSLFCFGWNIWGEKKHFPWKLTNIPWKNAGKLKYSYIPLQNASKCWETTIYLEKCWETNVSLEKCWEYQRHFVGEREFSLFSIRRCLKIPSPSTLTSVDWWIDPGIKHESRHQRIPTTLLGAPNPPAQSPQSKHPTRHCPVVHCVSHGSNQQTVAILSLEVHWHCEVIFIRLDHMESYKMRTRKTIESYPLPSMYGILTYIYHWN